MRSTALGLSRQRQGGGGGEHGGTQRSGRRRLNPHGFASPIHARARGGACVSLASVCSRQSEVEKRTNPTHERRRVGFIGAPIGNVEVMDRLSG